MCLCVCPVTQGAAGVRPGGGAPGYGLIGHGQPGGRLGRNHTGSDRHPETLLLRPVLRVKLSVTCCLCAGGVPGAAAVRSLLQNLRRLPAARGEGVALVRPQVQPAWSSDAGQPEQRLHSRVPAVPGLRAPGGSTEMHVDVSTCSVVIQVKIRIGLKRTVYLNAEMLSFAKKFVPETLGPEPNVKGIQFSSLLLYVEMNIIIYNAVLVFTCKSDFISCFADV